MPSICWSKATSGCVRNINCKLHVLDSCLLYYDFSLNILWLLPQYDLCDAGVYSRVILNMFFVGQVSGLVENFKIGIY